MSGHVAAVLTASLLAGFIAGVAVTSVIGYVFRERIRAAMIRRRRQP